MSGVGRGLPEGWAASLLGELVEVLDHHRVPISAKERAVRHGAIPYYGAAGQVGWIDQPLFDEDLILLGEDGVQFFDPSKVKAYLVSGPSWVNNHAHVLRPNTQIVDRRYLNHYLNHCDYHGHANGTTRLKLTKAAMLQIPVPLPPLAEQHRIVAALEEQLSRLDAAIASIEAGRARVSQLWASVLEQVTQGTLTRIRQYPAPWVRTDSVATIQGGIQKHSRRRPVENKFPFLRVANVPRGRLILDDVHEIELFGDEIERYRLKVGDLLVVEGNGSPDQIGRAALWHGDIENCVHQNHLIRVRPGSTLRPAFLELIWNSPSITAQLKRVASSTSGLHTLSTSKLKAVEIPHPSLEDQDALVTAAHAWHARQQAAEAALMEALARASALRRSLLAEAFAGRLVPQDPTDEPAETLLTRIRAEREAAAPQKKRRPRRTPAPRRAPEDEPTAPPPATTSSSAPLNGEQTTLDLELPA